MRPSKRKRLQTPVLEYSLTTETICYVMLVEEGRFDEVRQIFGQTCFYNQHLCVSIVY